MSKISFSVMMIMVAVCGLGRVLAEGGSEDVKAAAVRVKDKALRDHLLQNVDIFGQTDLPAIYILMPGANPEDEIRGSLLTRDFSRDPFFMQNIDREEFELKMSLRDFSDEDNQEKKKEESARR